MQLGDSSITSLVGAEILQTIRPIRGPPGLKQHNRVIRNPAVLFLPRLEVRAADLIVAIRGHFLGRVDFYRGADQSSERDLIDCVVAFGEMDRRVDVSAAVFGRAELIRRVVITFVVDARGDGVELEGLGSWPVNRIRREVVRQVNPLALRQSVRRTRRLPSRAAGYQNEPKNKRSGLYLHSRSLRSRCRFRRLSREGG